MLHVTQQSSFGPSLYEPRCPPNQPPPSPSLRQHIVRMVKKQPAITTDDVKRTELVRRPLVVISSNPQITRSITQHGFDEVSRRTPGAGFRKEVNQQRGPLEKQNSTLSIGRIRRLPLRPQRQNTSLSTKNDDREKCDKENANLNQSLSSTGKSSTNKSCEVKGNAIQSSQKYVGTQKKRMEIHKKTQQFSASLNEFKRRLMMNQGKFYQQHAGQDEQYKVDATKVTPTPPIQPRPPLTPRSPFTRTPFRRPGIDQVQTQLHGLHETHEVSPKPMYRLPLREATNQLHPVETYVVVQNQRERIRGKFDEPIALTMHNLSMHTMFVEMDERKKVDAKSASNARIQKWLENVHSSAIRPHRTVRFNILTSDSSSSAGDSDSSSSY